MRKSTFTAIVDDRVVATADHVKRCKELAEEYIECWPDFYRAYIMKNNHIVYSRRDADAKWFQIKFFSAEAAELRSNYWERIERKLEEAHKRFSEKKAQKVLDNLDQS